MIQVLGSNNIWALGDCSTNSTHQLRAVVGELFLQADKDGNELLSEEEFNSFMETVKEEYPQLEVLLQSTQNMFAYYDKNKDGSLSYDEFQFLLKEADKKLTSLPATAQVAAQQGKYLGMHFRSKELAYALDRELSQKNPEFREQVVKVVNEMHENPEGNAVVKVSDPALNKNEDQKIHLTREETDEERAGEGVGKKGFHVGKEQEDAETVATIRNKFPPFQYNHKGSLAYIGKEEAIADLPKVRGQYTTLNKPLEDQQYEMEII